VKTNFKSSKKVKHATNYKKPIAEGKKNFSKKEFEEFILKSGAIGTYMIFRSDKKDDELGLDEL